VLVTLFLPRGIAGLAETVRQRWPVRLPATPAETPASQEARP
jgi:hypothetical protein